MFKSFAILIFICVTTLFCFRYLILIDVRLRISFFRQSNESGKLQKRYGVEAIHKNSEMNRNLNTLRKTLLMISDANNNTLFLDKEPVVYIYETNESFHDILNKFQCVYQIKYPIKRRKEFHNSTSNWSNSSNVSDDNSFLRETFLIQDYYRLTGSTYLCYLIETNQISKNRGFVYNYTCNNDTKLAIKPIPLEPLRFNMKEPYLITKVLPDKYFIFPEEQHVLRIFVNSLISHLGEHYCDRLHVRPHDCLSAPGQRLSKSDQLKVQYHEEVFVISAFWGGAYFHRMAEDLPRLALFIKFLRRNPMIKILSADNSSLTQNALEVLGINKGRIITGWTRAKIAYIPRPTSCGVPFVLELQFLNHYYREYIKKHLTLPKRNKLILIKRSGQRYFTQHGLIDHYLRVIAQEFSLDYVVFKDNPAPTFNETMIMFGSASVIVAPHGAGLSNMLYSEPGTLIIEGVCNNPHLNLCYHITAYNLGMIYHAIVSREGCESYVDIDAKEITNVLKEYLSYIPIEQLTT